MAFHHVWGTSAWKRFDHFLLTRFSAVLRQGAVPATEDWLRYRLGFFYDATLPSVQSQSHANFTWLVLLDDRCSDTFRQDVTDLAADGSFKPIWSHEPFRRDTFAPYVTTRSTAPHLITTRIDSHDAIATDFMARVQQQFSGQERLFVNFTRGLQMNRSGMVYRSDQISSPFLTLIERNDDPMTVYAPKHARARGHGTLREVRAPAMWLQVVHGNNLSNIINGPRVAPTVIADRFTIDLKHRAQVPPLQLIAEKAVQRRRLLHLWARHPGELTKYVEATAWRLRGTHERPQGTPRTLSDRVGEYAVRRGYRPRER